MTTSFGVGRKIGQALALDFVEEKITKSASFYDSEELSGDDHVALPEGKIVKISIEFVDAEEAKDGYTQVERGS